MRDGAMVVDDVAEPVPSFGQVLVQVKACGICGSDLHFVKHGHKMMALSDEMRGVPEMGEAKLDFGRDIFMGHEFAAEVLEAGPDTVAPAAGSLVTSIPIMLTMSGVQNLAYTNELPSGYGERMLLSAPMLSEVPNGLSATHAALTEPMAVGLHAVNKSGIGARDGAIVLGCGPVGLAVIASLKLKGVEPIVAADFSPARRALAVTMGAHEVVDPAVDPAFDAWDRAGKGRPVVVFEAVGVTGIINSAMRDAPLGSRLVIVGVCMEQDAITPFFGIGKELNLQFVLGYTPDEFAASLGHIAEGRIDVAPLVTGEVDLDGVPAAFEALATPEHHCKIIVAP
jgi:threonine dehydrogenase-like Zn-dependent dehydrogenase